jgi:hypothetical protein
MKLTPTNIQSARRHLRAADPVMRAIIDTVGPYTLRFERDRFAMLVRSIVSQQISTSAARAIRRRLQDLAGAEGLTAAICCKPDTHITDIFRDLSLSDGTPLDVFHAVAKMAADVGETPYAVDKVFWLIGSGRLYNHGRTFDTDKFEFVKATLARWEHTALRQHHA